MYLHEKSKDQIEYDESHQNATRGQMGIVKVAVGGMGAFACCLVTFVVCLGAGLPIFFFTFFVDQWQEFTSCTVSNATTISPCIVTSTDYFCPILVRPECGSDVPPACLADTYNTSTFTNEEQLVWYVIKMLKLVCDRTGQVLAVLVPCEIHAQKFKGFGFSRGRYNLATTDTISLFCCTDELWCTTLYDNGIADGSKLIVGTTTAEVRDCHFD